MEEREARIVQLGTNQWERLADETGEQREARLQRAKESNIRRASGKRAFRTMFCLVIEIELS